MVRESVCRPLVVVVRALALPALADLRGIVAQKLLEGTYYLMLPMQLQFLLLPLLESLVYIVRSVPLPGRGKQPPAPVPVLML